MSASTAASPARIYPESRTGRGPDAPRSIVERIRSNGCVCFRVFGGSMFPWLRAGDIVFARRCELELAKIGDVVLFECDGRLFVHRVLQSTMEIVGGIPRRCLITKGDAQDGADAPVTASEFLGRVIRLNRGRRHIDLESFVQVVRGRLLALVSRRTVPVYRSVRKIKRFLFA